MSVLRSRSAPGLLALTALLGACGAPPAPGGEAPRALVRALSLPAGSFVTLDLTGPSSVSRGAMADANGTASFPLSDLRTGEYAVTARAYDREAAPRVALYRGRATHAFTGDTFNLKLNRLTSDLRVEVTGAPNTPAHLRAIAGNLVAGLAKTGTTAEGVLRGVPTGTNRLVVVEARATPDGPVTHRGEATVTVQEDNAQNVARVALSPVTAPAPATPVLSGAANVPINTPYALDVAVPASSPNLSHLLIDWGDGTVERVDVDAGEYRGTRTHTYRAAPAGGFTVTATAYNTAGVSAASNAVPVTVVDATTGTVVVGAEDDVTEVTLRVTNLPGGTDGVSALVRDPAGALRARDFRPEYPLELVPDGRGAWTATLGLTRGRAFAVTPTARVSGAPVPGAPVAFTPAGDAATVNVPFSAGGGGGAAPAVSLDLLDPVSGAPRSGGLDATLPVRFVVRGVDPEGDALRCELDAQGDGTFETDLGDCATPRAHTFTYAATGAFTRFVPRVRVSDGANTVRRAAVVTVGRNPQKWVSGYYALYESNFQSPDRIDFRGLTHLFVGAVMPWATPSTGNEYDEDEAHWTYDGVFDDKYAPASVMTDAVQRAHAAGKKAVMMVGGSGGFQYWGLTLALRPERLQNTATRLIELLDKHGFDGIDLDYESPGPAMDMEGLARLAEELRARRPDLILTFAGNWENKNTPDLDPWVPRHAHLFDQINMMSYDMGGPYDGWLTWHTSALYDDTNESNTPTSVNHTVNAYLGLSGVYEDLGLAIPANKVGVGIGFYGSCLRRNYAPRETPSGEWPGNGDGEMAYWRIVSFYGRHPELNLGLNDLRRWDDRAKAPYLTSRPLGSEPDGTARHLDYGYARQQPHLLQDCDFVSYEDAQSIGEKANYVFDRGLGGTIIWTVSQTYIPNLPGVPAPANGDRNPLLTATRQAFRLP